jgi:8-oxo-dGTP pyrophosphatase MutT (NUDIX family)
MFHGDPLVLIIVSPLLTTSLRHHTLSIIRYNISSTDLSCGHTVVFPTMSDRSLHFSDSFAISCGTVTVDLARAKVLLVYLRTTGEYLLPKGRKDIGETLEQTALRETFEETGHRVELLPLNIPTLATAPVSHSSGKEHDETITEPIAVTQRVTKDDTLKIIFWFAASGDSTGEWQEGTQEEGEEFDTVWVPAGDVLQTLSFEDDRKITEMVLNML